MVPQSAKARARRPPLTLLVPKLPDDQVQGAHLGLERLHQLSADEDLVLIRPMLSHQGHLGPGHVIEAQPGRQRVSSFLSIDATATKLKRFRASVNPRENGQPYSDE